MAASRTHTLPLNGLSDSQVSHHRMTENPALFNSWTGQFQDQFCTCTGQAYFPSRRQTSFLPSFGFPFLGRLPVDGGQHIGFGHSGKITCAIFARPCPVLLFVCVPDSGDVDHPVLGESHSIDAHTLVMTSCLVSENISHWSLTARACRARRAPSSRVREAGAHRRIGFHSFLSPSSHRPGWDLSSLHG